MNVKDSNLCSLFDNRDEFYHYVIEIMDRSICKNLRGRSTFQSKGMNVLLELIYGPPMYLRFGI